jgi:predicted GTPase
VSVGTPPLVLVAGKPNVGKTLLALNFAAYLGEPMLSVTVVDSTGRPDEQRLRFEHARRAWVSSTPHSTLVPLAIQVTLPGRRGRRSVRILDTPALVDTVSDRDEVRHGMAETLKWLTEAEVVMHVVDAAAYGRRELSAAGPVDMELMGFQRMVPGYVVIANKIDRPEAAGALRRLRAALAGGPPLIPASALTRQGFRELKTFLLRYV